jgi:hypothetical protein
MGTSSPRLQHGECHVDLKGGCVPEMSRSGAAAWPSGYGRIVDAGIANLCINAYAARQKQMTAA